MDKIMKAMVKKYKKEFIERGMMGDCKNIGHGICSDDWICPDCGK